MIGNGSPHLDGAGMGRPSQQAKLQRSPESSSSDGQQPHASSGWGPISTSSVHLIHGMQTEHIVESSRLGLPTLGYVALKQKQKQKRSQLAKYSHNGPLATSAGTPRNRSISLTASHASNESLHTPNSISSLVSPDPNHTTAPELGALDIITTINHSPPIITAPCTTFTAIPSKPALRLNTTSPTPGASTLTSPSAMNHIDSSWMDSQPPARLLHSSDGLHTDATTTTKKATVPTTPHELPLLNTHHGKDQDQDPGTGSTKIPHLPNESTHAPPSLPRYQPTRMTKIPPSPLKRDLTMSGSMDDTDGDMGGGRISMGLRNKKMKATDCLLFAATLLSEEDAKSPSSPLRTKQNRSISLSLRTEEFDGSSLTKPHDVDVLCGRGGLINKHRGNVVYRRVVDYNKPFYQSVHKKHRILVSQSIVQCIANSGGRFLTLGAKGKPWVEIGYKRAVQKTSQALRERASSQGEEHEDDDDDDEDEDEEKTDEYSKEDSHHEDDDPQEDVHPGAVGGRHYTMDIGDMDGFIDAKMQPC